MKKPTRFIALCLGLCLTLPGCGEPLPEPVPTASPESTATPAPASAQFSLGYDPAASLHPITGDSQVNQELTGLVYQGLYELDNTFTPQPVLVKSASVSEDGLTWGFTMAEHVYFSDGAPLTAQHAAASLNAARAAPLYAARLSGVSAVWVGEDGLVYVGLSAPNGNLPALLDIPVVLEQGEDPPLGTGCYRYERSGERLFLQANPYHRSVSALPYATIPLTAVSGADQRIAAFDSGDITAVTTDFSSAYALGYSSSCETWDYPTTALLYMGFNTTKGPCQSNLVRQAFSRILDREGLAAGVLSGHGDPAVLPVSPLCGDYDTDAAGQLSRDPDAAARLLAEAGYEKNGEDGLLYLRKTPLEVTLLVNSDNDTRQAAAGQIAGDLARLGVAVSVKRLPWKDFTAALAGGQFDLYIGEVRLTGDFDTTVLLAGELNYGGYRSDGFALALEGWKAARGEGRTQAAQVLWAQFAQDAPIAPLCFKRGSLLVRWGMVSNLQPTRANPYCQIEQWTTAG